MSNSSVLPDIKDTCLNSFNITEEDILSVIKSLESNKSYEWNNILTKMITMWGESLTSPLKMIFDLVLRDGVFPDGWKKCNIVPVYRWASKIC